MNKLMKTSAIALTLAVLGGGASAATATFTSLSDAVASTGGSPIEAGDLVTLGSSDLEVSTSDLVGIGIGESVLSDVLAAVGAGAANTGLTFDFSGGAVFTITSSTILVEAGGGILFGGRGDLVGDLDGDAGTPDESAEGSWLFASSSSDDDAPWSLTIEVPPSGDVPPPIPLPAGGVLLLSGLGAAAFLRRKRA